MSKKYSPKKKRYNDLVTLSNEMTNEKVKHEFDGISIKTKKQTFLLFDGDIVVKETHGSN
jgi:hypothetical protein